MEDDEFHLANDEVASEHMPTHESHRLPSYLLPQTPRQSQPPMQLMEQDIASEKEEEDHCSVHKKQFQAMCQDDMQLMCIDCIILDAETHRGHKMLSVELAHRKHRSFL